jgi:hypothetical protein
MDLSHSEWRVSPEVTEEARLRNLGNEILLKITDGLTEPNGRLWWEMIVNPPSQDFVQLSKDTGTLRSDNWWCSYGVPAFWNEYGHYAWCINTSRAAQNGDLQMYRLLTHHIEDRLLVRRMAESYRLVFDRHKESRDYVSLREVCSRMITPNAPRPDVEFMREHFRDYVQMVLRIADVVERGVNENWDRPWNTKAAFCWQVFGRERYTEKFAWLADLKPGDKFLAAVAESETAAVFRAAMMEAT